MEFGRIRCVDKELLIKNYLFKLKQKIFISYNLIVRMKQRLNTRRIKINLHLFI